MNHYSELRRLAIEASVTLFVHLITACLAIGVILWFGISSGDIRTKPEINAYLLWSGVGLATGASIATLGVSIFLFRKAYKLGRS